MKDMGLLLHNLRTIGTHHCDQRMVLPSGATFALKTSPVAALMGVNAR